MSIEEKKMYVGVFPGQGSQFVGMGKKLYEKFPEARYVFEEADDVLSYKLSKIIFEGPKETLDQTCHTQPALLIVSLAILRILQVHYEFSLDNFSFFAGHSLGEYTALCASGVLSIQQAVNLLNIRALAMQKAPKGGMLAVLGLSHEGIASLINEIPSSLGLCEIANDNCPGQIVVSGTFEALEFINTYASKLGAKRCIKLNVSVPSHCSLMQEVTQDLRSALEETLFNSPFIPIITNVSGAPQTDPDTLKLHLVRQLTDTVQWTKTQQFFEQTSVTFLTEIGSGKVLSNMAKRTLPKTKIFSIYEEEEIKPFLCAVRESNAKLSFAI